jgi:pyridoxine 5-phosphate synthase
LTLYQLIAMTKLSVNINKIATLRNSRGENLPNLTKLALDCERFGAEGITVHPRPDERHIRYQDVYELRPLLKTEFNIEGNPVKKFIDLVMQVRPHQVTLVPDTESSITSDAGWDTIKFQTELTDYVNIFHSAGIRVSIFVDADEKMVEAAAKTGTDRVELYTGPYAKYFQDWKEKSIEKFLKASHKALEVGLGLNAGHDLNLDNLSYFKNSIPNLLEVSIGHALISDALYFGLENTIQLYKRQLM